MTSSRIASRALPGRDGRDRALLGLRLSSGCVFIAFGAGKFTNHASELASFRGYGLPAPEAFVVAIGAIELVGSVLLIAGWTIRPTAAVLAADMVGAILVSGIAHGEPISLTLAPAELLAMLLLLRAGPGAYVFGSPATRTATAIIRRAAPACSSSSPPRPRPGVRRG